MKQNKLIIFGPWCGEFSYELKWWIPEIRKIRNEEFKDYDAFMLGFNGREFLYNDFIDKYIAYPTELQDTLKYPSSYGEHIHGSDIIPDNLQKYLLEVSNKYVNQYEEVALYAPGAIPIGDHRTKTDKSYGHYRCYKPCKEVNDDIAEQLKFENNNNVITIMARQRYRNGVPDVETWNPDHWITFTKLILSNLDVNIIFINLEVKNSSGGSYDFTAHDFNTQYSNRVKHLDLSGKNSVEMQIALLQQTNCSIYGASGAALIAVFAGTNLFTQQTSKNGYRIHLEYKQFINGYVGESEDLNFNAPVVFDKHISANIWDLPPTDLFNEFIKYYTTLNKTRAKI